MMMMMMMMMIMIIIITVILSQVKIVKESITDNRRRGLSEKLLTVCHNRIIF